MDRASAKNRTLGPRRISMRPLVAAKRPLGPRRGSARLDRVLVSAAPTRTELEDVVHDLIIDGVLPRLDVNSLCYLTAAE